MLKIERVRELARSKGLRHDWIAEQCGLKRNTFYGYMCGARQPSSSVLILLAQLLGCSTDYLEGKTNEINGPVKAVPKRRSAR